MSQIENRPIRILHVLGCLNLGGAESFVMNLYRTINREKVQFDFVKHTGDVGEYEEEIIKLGGRIYCCTKFNGVNFLSYSHWWRNFFEEHTDYSILHSHIRSTASVFFPIAKKHGLVTIAHSHSTSNGTGFQAVIKYLMQLPIRREADYLFACSQEAGEWLFGRKACRQFNFKIIPNAIDFGRFAYKEAKRNCVRRELDIQDEYVIGNVGRLVEAKNHILLLKIFQAFHQVNKNSKLLLVGDGPLREKLSDSCRDLEIADSVIFAGAQTNVEDYYQAMDVFVFPSLWEGFAIALIEAQISGLKCIASDVVPSMADVGLNLLKRISLKKSAAEWSQYIVDYGDFTKNIYNRNCRRKSVNKSNINSEYNIETLALQMENFYLKQIK